jgi:hypothetical protein
VEEKAVRHSALREFMDAVDREGPLMPQAYVPMVLDVSSSRVCDLIEEGRIARLEIRGKFFVPIASLNIYLADERKAGRPVKKLARGQSLGKFWKDGWQRGKRAAEKKGL